MSHLQEAIERYLLQRRYIDNITHSIPFYLVIGNHEGEQGWYFSGRSDLYDNLAVISTLARQAIIPNPSPDGFFTGNLDRFPEYRLGLREDYFAWEWGDALFVVLAPFWYTKVKPHHHGSTGDDPGWHWTLGKEQYDWLHATLHDACAKWKFVLIHHLTSTAVRQMSYPYYGRGGIEVAKFKVAGKPSYEWGGEDRDGNFVFASMRPGWTHGPVHDLLVDERATILFHGHDHFFAKQDLDGIVYQECPQPANTRYDFGFKISGEYKEGDFIPNSGHLNVHVGPDTVVVDYVRAYLPGDGENGTISYSYIIDKGRFDTFAGR